MATIPLKPVISTGNTEIDNKMGGGIPLNSLTLIEGDSHAGKSVLAQQMIWGSLREGFRISLFTSENTVRSLMSQMNSLELSVQDYLFLGRLRVFPLEVARAGNKILDDLSAAIVNEARSGSEMVVVDALTPFIVTVPLEEVLGFFEKSKRLCAQGKTVLAVIHSHAVSQELLVRITSMCDAHLRLRTEEAGDKLVKAMEVAKVRGANRNTGNIVSFEVEPGLGMRIIPISKAQA
jgi:flagellar protein FlaH